MRCLRYSDILIQTKLGDKSGGAAKRRAVTLWVGRVFAQLTKVASARSQLPSRFRDLVDYENGTVTGLLSRLADAATSTSIPGEFVAIGKEGLLTGLSRFMGGESHPVGYRKVVLVVVGGVTWDEVGLVRDVFQRRGREVLVISNSVVGRDGVMGHIFKSK